MTLVLTIILLLILFIVVFVIILFLLLIRDDIVNSVPFVPVQKHAIGQIIELLQLSNQSVLYDLGCGDGRVLIAAIKEKSTIVAVGVENGIIPFLISKIRTYKFPFKLVFNDFFKVNISEATHIFCYLSNSVLKELAPKILRECKKGTKIVTCDFYFSDWEPIEIRSVKTMENSLSRMLYTYVV